MLHISGLWEVAHPFVAKGDSNVPLMGRWTSIGHTTLTTCLTVPPEWDVHGILSCQMDILTY